MTLRAAAAFSLVAAVACDPGGPALSAGDLAILDAPPERLAIVLGSDHDTGAYAVVDLVDHAAVKRIELTHGDAHLRVADDGLAYVINRLNADNVQVVDPSERFRTTAQWSVGPGSNPQDIAVVGGQAFVPLYARPAVAVHDAATGAAVTEIDLSSLSDADGNPELGGVLASADGRLLVTAQRIDRETLAPAGGSRLAVIDPGAATLIEDRPLRLPNPGLPPVRLSDGRLLLAAWGAAAAVDGGGVEIVDAEAPYDSEVVVGEEVFGGTLTGLTSIDGDTVFVIASVPRAGSDDGLTVDTVLYRYVASTDERTEVLALPGFSFGDIALTADGLLLVCDRTYEAPGLRIFDASTLEERTAAPIDTGLPPLRVAPLVSPCGKG